MANRLGHEAEFSDTIYNAGVAFWMGYHKGSSMKGLPVTGDPLFRDGETQHSDAGGDILNLFLTKPNKIHG